MRRAAVAGIAALPYSKDIGMTEREAGARALHEALGDAGLTGADVDGLVRYSWETTTEQEMARIINVGNLRFFGSMDYGGGAGAPVVALAAMAIEHGVADIIGIWRARNRSSSGRPWSRQLAATGDNQFEWPHGLLRPADTFAMHTRYWMDTWGWTSEQLGHVALIQRQHAQNNPMALMRDPLTLDDYMEARFIADPLRLYDCCLETDGALAMVLVAEDRLADLDVTPVYVGGYAWGTGPDMHSMTFYYGDRLGRTPGAWIGPELWRRTWLTPDDIDVVQFYDAFSPEVLISFEEYGFCAAGESAHFVAGGHAPPFNTSGGGLSEAYVHGFNHLVEGVRQIRGSSPNQVASAACSLVTSSNVVPTGAIVFTAEAVT